LFTKAAPVATTESSTDPREPRARDRRDGHSPQLGRERDADHEVGDSLFLVRCGKANVWIGNTAARRVVIAFHGLGELAKGGNVIGDLRQDL
jgi:hypothetical protein